jgi:threonyl-tRNA synthetase
LWLAPEQVRVLPIGEESLAYARSLMAELRAQGVRVEIDPGSGKINGKIQRAELEKVHTMLVIGQREMDANAVAVRLHGKGMQGVKPRAEVVADLLASIRERRAN